MNTQDLFIDGNKLPKPLTKNEIYDLFNKKSQGDVFARETIINHNIRLVLYEVINRFKTVNYDKNDLVSIGIIGLIKAVDTFNTLKKNEFVTYASHCIDNEILMFLRKIKYNQNVMSLDEPIGFNKEGDEFILSDVLSDDVDIESNYIENELYQSVRNLVTNLPYRDREIVIMYFGFNNDNRYTENEIAKKLELSQSYVSRLIKKIVKKLKEGLDESSKEKVEFNLKKSFDNSKVKTRKLDKQNVGKEMGKQLQTIYEYFDKYSKEQVDEMLVKLTDEERELLALRYGKDFNQSASNGNFTKEQYEDFYYKLLPKMKRLLSNPNKVRKKYTRKTKEPQMKEEIEQNLSLGNIEPEKIETTQKAESLDKSNSETEITKDDYIKILELLKTPIFDEMMEKLSSKEFVIISLKLGYIDGKYFSTETIANFLGIEESEVIETTKKTLLTYKKSVNEFIDKSIQIITNDKKEINGAKKLAKTILK